MKPRKRLIAEVDIEAACRRFNVPSDRFFQALDEAKLQRELDAVSRRIHANIHAMERLRSEGKPIVHLLDHGVRLEGVRESIAKRLFERGRKP